MTAIRLVILLCLCGHADLSQAASFGIVRSAAPFLNTSAFSSVFGGADGKSLTTDRCGQVRALEFVALPGTVVTIRSTVRDGNRTIYQVETDEYPRPAGSLLYVDSRFVELRTTQPPPRPRILPSQQVIIDSLKATVGTPYVWGGNVASGSAELMELYYTRGVPAAARSHLSLAGLDCSGLLYQATGGWTPRNTSQLVSFGRPVQISEKSAEAIARLLEPLDLIVWNGHVIIVLDGETVIESRLECGRAGNGGVVISGLQQRMREVLQTRRPANSWPAAGKQRDVFVVRRWFSP